MPQGNNKGKICNRYTKDCVKGINAYHQKNSSNHQVPWQEWKHGSEGATKLSQNNKMAVISLYQYLNLKGLNSPNKSLIMTEKK